MIETNRYYFKKCKNINKNLPSTILNKPFIKFDNICSVPEIVILNRLCKKLNLEGFWVDNFHKKIRYTLDNTENINNLSIKIRNKINKINNNKISGCWDLILYDKFGKNIKFVEIKRLSKDKMRQSQIKWHNQCKKAGFKNKDFMIIEWAFKR